VKLATYNILKGGSLRVHWVRMIEDHSVDLLLVQESYAHHEHLPPLMYPNAGKQSAWEMAEKNGWGSAVFSRTGSVKPVAVPNFTGWVVGVEISGASWQAGIADPLLAFSVHAPSKGEA
jgi:exonuclease III